VGRLTGATVDTPGRLLPWQIVHAKGQLREGFEQLRWQHVAGKLVPRYVYVVRERVNDEWYYLTMMTNNMDPVRRHSILRVSTKMDMCFSMHGLTMYGVQWISVVSVRGAERGTVHMKWGYRPDDLLDGTFYDTMRSNSDLAVKVGTGSVQWAKVGQSAVSSRIILVVQVDGTISSFFVSEGSTSEDTEFEACGVYNLDGFSTGMPVRFTLEGVRMMCVHRILFVNMFPFDVELDVQECVTPAGMFPVRACQSFNGYLVLFGSANVERAPVLLVQTFESLPMWFSC
jgi:hypothetical protein